MSDLTFMDGFQLPLQRRLSRLYNDTKNSTDFVKDSVQNAEDPDRKALHRKLRIQKDRLACWGLEWSDPNQAVEIDASLSRAGLSEVVGSIMSTIKDTLAEAEPLWQSLMHPVTGKPSPDRKVPLVQWDKDRFEDLVRDLTASIDTLYDLSRTRSSTHLQGRISKTAYKPFPSSWPEDEFRPFESSRMKTPRQINPQTLTRLRPNQQGDADIPPREVVFMSQTAYSELAQSTASEEPLVPLLLEYAVFDSIYSVTGIMPPMSRFEKLSSGLQQDPQRAPRTWTGLPHLLGYFEDPDHSRIGLVYTFPPLFNAISLEQLTNNPRYKLPTLSDVLQRQAEPPLEAKFRLAYNLVNTVFDMHARGFAHGGLDDKNVSFCDITTTTLGMQDMPLLVDIRRPLVSSFDLFPEDRSMAQGSPWRHPFDPRGTVSAADRPVDERAQDLYPLAMMLLSIGLWTKLEHLLPDTTPAVVSTSALDQLAIKCGTLYMRAAQTCWHAVDNDLGGEVYNVGNLLSAVQMQVSRFLETCCILDGVSGFEHRLGQELREIPPSSIFEERSALAKNTRSSPDFPTDKKLPLLPAEAHQRRDHDEFVKRTSSVEAEHQGTQSSIGQLGSLAIRSEPPPKMRLYPHVPIPPDIINKWNDILMPQVNQTLRQFYRNHPESVEISLESVGPNPHETKPTVVVICSSVGKVRAILKKRLGELFDETTGFALKVCRGHIVRSRRQFRTVPRSMALSSNLGIKPGGDADIDSDETEAANPQYQECPTNGASIGAWTGDRHLPPVSFGGLILVDDKPYGMTVHHMLDDPGGETAQTEPLRSSSLGSGYDWHAELTDRGGGHNENDVYTLSDTESESYTETDITSNYGDGEEEEEEEETEDEFEPGDIPGIEPGCGAGYIITQPALDDVEEGFYPCAETEDEDHLDTFNLGEVYASSGIRRKQANGLTHEVDWALFAFEDGRLPDHNSIPCWDDTPAAHKAETQSWDGHDLHTLRPTMVVPSPSLPGLEVQCMARTSGLQIGRILAALTSVKIYGRCSPSHAYQIASMPSGDARTSMNSDVPIGIPGDSGAWVVDRRHGQLCGHVLAWSQRKRVAYICPMDVLLLDVAQTLDAAEVRLPGGGEPVVALEGPRLATEHAGYVAKTVEDSHSDDVAEDMLAGGSGEVSPCYSVMKRTEIVEAAATPTGSSRSTSGYGSMTPIRLETSYEPRGLATRLEDLHIGHALRNLGQWVDSHA
ncbi:hypothetical protein E4U31_002149 [Claviceps sp. LM219 group G6]|nr:hypothetical protein E4U31_002149 [Claviceps sp. LM219 group G6]